MLNHKILSTLLELPRFVKQGVVIVLDTIMSLIAVWLSFYLRIEQVGMPLHEHNIVYFLAGILFLPIFIRAGLYRAIFRYTGMNAMAATAVAVMIYGILFFGILLLLQLLLVSLS